MRELGAAPYAVMPLRVGSRAQPGSWTSALTSRRNTAQLTYSLCKLTIANASCSTSSCGNLHTTVPDPIGAPLPEQKWIRHLEQKLVIRRRPYAVLLRG